MLQIAAAIFMLLHGLIHLVGVITFWKLGLHDQYSTKVLGSVDIGERAMYVFGFFWLVITVAYVVVAYAMAADLSWWRDGLAAATVGSLALTVLGWKDAIFGTAINIVILVVLFAV